MENKTNGLVYVLQMDRQSMPNRLVWDSCLGPGMLLVLLPSLRRCRIHKALLTNRDAVTLGENDMTCVKTWLLKWYKNPDTGAIKNKCANVPTSWKFRGFWSLSLSRKSQVQGTSMCSTFHLQHTKVESYAPNTQRNMLTTTYETFVYNIMKIRSGYLELLRVNRHGKCNRHIL
jgi:hypothetical protein